MSLPDEMRAVRLHAPATTDGRADLAVERIARPDPSPVEVLVEVGACGLSGSDRRVVDGTIASAGPLPRTVGHEAAGTVAAVGAEVLDWQPGDRVAVLDRRACHRCGYCAAGRDNLCLQGSLAGVDHDGALAGYLVTDPASLVPVPPGVTLDQAAITTGAVATPYHAMKRAGVAEGATVAIIGLGGLGMHAVQLAKLAGAWVVGVDVDPDALERALDWGADEVVNASGSDPVAAVHDLTGGGADRAMEFVGTPDTVDRTVRCLAPGGRAVLVGLSRAPLATVPIARFVGQELDVVGSSGATAKDVGELFDLLDEGRLDLTRSVTDTTDLDGAAEALAAGGDRPFPGIRTVVTDLS